MPRADLPNALRPHRATCAARCRSTPTRRHDGGGHRQPSRPARTPRPRSAAVPHHSNGAAALAPKIPSPDPPTTPKHTLKGTLKSARYLPTQDGPRRMDTVEPAAHRGNRWKAGRQHSPGQPAPRSRYRIASTIRRSGHLRGRPTCDGDGKNGSSTANSASVKSLGKPGLHGHTEPEWCRSTSLISLVRCKTAGSEAVHSTINDLGLRQANPMVPLNLISDQTLKIYFSMQFLRFA